MIVLDTNVVSELMRAGNADPRVVAWFGSQRRECVTTVMNRAELLAGVALLPVGVRRERLASAVRMALDGLGVCLPMTDEASDHYADIVAMRRGLGRPIGVMDALIAAICLAGGAAIATRDAAGFADVGLEVIDPWADR